MELSKWLESNKIQSLPPEDKIFEFDETEQSEIRSAKPWERDPNYFKYCKVAATALIKMAIHAHSGGNIEVFFFSYKFEVLFTKKVLSKTDKILR